MGYAVAQLVPITVAERSKAKVCCRSLAGIAGSNRARDMDVCVVCVVQYGQKAKPGQSGQRSTDKVQRENKREQLVETLRFKAEVLGLNSRWDRNLLLT
jgi:hypothetical protein